jgi:hypothetical protein
LETRGPSRDVRGLFFWCRLGAAGARGFSHLELLLVLGVTALMGTLAISAYRTFTVRGQVTVGILGAAAIQQRVAMEFKRDGAPPLETAGLGAELAEAATEFVESVEIVHGRIDLRFGHSADEAIAGSILSLTPFETAEQDIVWVCGNRAPSVGLQPLGFMNGPARAATGLTTIGPRYLPSTCR